MAVRQDLRTQQNIRKALQKINKINEMEKNVEVQSSGLKCDNTNCDYDDSTVKFEDLSKWVDKPCPKCGENLLTLEDFQRAEILMKTVDLVNSISPELFGQMDEKSRENTINFLSNTPTFKDAIGLENLKEDVVSISVETHNEIKVTEIKKAE